MEGAPQGLLRALPFDAMQHALLSEELKHLYTAITRAKSNGWSQDTQLPWQSQFHTSPDDIAAFSLRHKAQWQ